MKIGVLAFISETSIDTVTIARKTESLGFDGFYLPEHPIIPVVCKSSYPGTPDGSIPDGLAHFIDPFIGLAQAAAVTSKIELGTGICLVPEHDPIILAKEIATLDLCSGGRFIFGIGAGWLAEESAVMGVDFKRRWPMTREYIRAMKELWTRDEASFEGEFVKFPALRSNPKPAQKPHPPVHIGAGGDRALRNTALIGDGWAPIAVRPDDLKTELAKLRQFCAEVNREFSKLEITIFSPVGGSDSRDAVEAYRAAGAHRLILFPPTLAPDRYEAELEELAKSWIV